MCEATLRAIDGFAEGDQFEERDMGRFMDPSNRSLAVLIIVSRIFGVGFGFALQSRESTVPALFIFGDSAADAGTNNYIPNSRARVDFPPYGRTFFHRPTGRFTDGRTVFDFIASMLKLAFPPPYLKEGADFSQGANFASGGSGLLDSTGELLNIIPMSVQISQFKKLSASMLAATTKNNGGSFVLSKSLYAIQVGANDFAFYITNHTYQNSTSSRDFIDLLLTKYKEYLLDLYNSGARNFVVGDIFPLGCTPIARLAVLLMSNENGGCLESANELVMDFNGGLQHMIRNMKHNDLMTEATILVVHSFPFFLDVIHDGKAHGFSETESGCCGAGPFNAAVDCGKDIPEEYRGKYKEFLCSHPDKYLFWDATHRTDKFHELLAQLIWNGNSSFISPFNLESLVQEHTHPGLQYSAVGDNGIMFDDIDSNYEL